MSKTRIPRKLKKGCRTLNGNPRTKWQRKGRLHLLRTMEAFSKTISAAVVGADALRRLAESINPIKIPHGGIVMMPTDPPKVGINYMPMNEIVMNRQQLKKLAHPIIVTPQDCVHATISAEHLQDVLT